MRFALRTKLFALTTFMVTLIMVTVTWFLTIRHVEARRQAVIEEVARITTIMASLPPIERQDWVGYQEIIDRQLEVNRDIVFIAVYDDRNWLRAHGLNGDLVEVDAATRSSHRLQAEVVRQLDRGGVAVESQASLRVQRVNIRAPGDRVLGSVHVGLSLIKINRDLRSGVRANALLAIGFIGLAGALSFILSRRLTGPIERLRDAMAAIAAGDRELRVAPETSDEIGELAVSFNEMVVALSEQERMRSELLVARAVQRRLLPSGSPVIPGYQLGGVCHPAAEVGGDYFDFLRLRDGTIGIVVADVSGKGASASLYMAEIKGMMLSIASLHPSPRTALIELNRHLYPSLERRVFASVLYGVLDPRSRRLAFARAGHPPLLRLTADGECDAFPTAGMAVGLDSGPLFDKNLEEAVLELAAGDMVVMYTDGITDAMSAERQSFGTRRLIDALRGAPDPASAQGSVIDAVQAFAGAQPQFDDLTLVTLRCLGRAEV